MCVYMCLLSCLCLLGVVCVRVHVSAELCVSAGSCVCVSRVSSTGGCRGESSPQTPNLPPQSNS